MLLILRLLYYIMNSIFWREIKLRKKILPLGKILNQGLNFLFHIFGLFNCIFFGLLGFLKYDEVEFNC